MSHGSYYPSCAYGSSFHSGSNSLLKYNFGLEDKESNTNEYRYGRTRRRLYYWERDRNSYNRLWRNRRRRRNRRGQSPQSRENSPPPKPEPKPEPPKEEVAKKLLVKDVNFHVQENVENNNTDAFECTDVDRKSGEAPELVVRRGNFMKLTITFDRPYEKENHDLKLFFTIGKTPKISKGTMAKCKVRENDKKTGKPTKWRAYLDSQSGNDITVMVRSAVNCMVGEWNLAIKSFVSKGTDGNGKENKLVFKYEHDEDIIILFNPWNEDDGVYMENTDDLKEYICNESGAVYVGNQMMQRGKPWNFGQFEEGILDICLYLLRSGFKDGVSADMANPIQAARIIAKMVNSQDDNGVLVGNWSGEYAGGTDPSAWVGSPRILKLFMKNGPVCFGQCWVFSCLTTTVCRCLGIPCRTVTNFQSAHDTDSTNVIEHTSRFNEKGELERHHSSSDSVWNFHVWNDVWMKRPDLGENDFHGWQAIDATPQELSGGVYTCGPCPLNAVKLGRVDLNYDTAFVYSEVNADEAYFYVQPDDTWQLQKVRSKSVGKKISTKFPDGKPLIGKGYNKLGWLEKEKYLRKRRLDITDQYKFPEGSEEERNANRLAFKLAKTYKAHMDPYEANPVSEKVTFSLHHSNDVMIGSDLEIEVMAKNHGVSRREVLNITLCVSPKSYIGEVGHPCFVQYLDMFNLEGGQEKKFKVVVTPTYYYPKLVDQANLHIEADGLVRPIGDGSLENEMTSHDFTFNRPSLDLEGPDDGQLGKPVEFKVSFKNPAPVDLTDCVMSMGSSGFDDVEDVHVSGVPVGGTYTGKFTMTPKRKKEHQVTFTFGCRELKDLTGSTSIEIFKK